LGAAPYGEYFPLGQPPRRPQAQVPVHEDDLDSDLDEFDMGTLDDVQEHYF
jgi:hypothetical protein